MKKKTLTQLRADLEKAKKKFHSLRESVHAAEQKRKLPALKKQFEGTFWKYRNCGGTGDQWFVYTYCKKVLNESRFLCDTFQSSHYDKKFNVNSEEFEHLFEIKIERQEYMDALIEFHSMSQLMIDNVFNADA